MTQLFDLNARIQQLTWSLIFYEKYSTSLSTIILVVLTIANFGGFSNFCRYYTRSQTGKSTGYRPTLKPLGYMYPFTFIFGGAMYPLTLHLVVQRKLTVFSPRKVPCIMLFFVNITQSWRKLFFSVWHWVRQEVGFCLTHGLCVCPTIFL